MCAKGSEVASEAELTRPGLALTGSAHARRIAHHNLGAPCRQRRHGSGADGAVTGDVEAGEAEHVPGGARASPTSAGIATAIRGSDAGLAHHGTTAPPAALERSQLTLHRCELCVDRVDDPR